MWYWKYATIEWFHYSVEDGIFDVTRRNILRWRQKFSRLHWLIFTVNKQTDTWFYNLCDVSTSTSGQICHRKTQIDASFSCVCLVIDNEFRHQTSKYCTDPLGYRLVNPQLIWQYYDEIRDQKQDRRMKTWRQFVNFSWSLVSRPLVKGNEDSGYEVVGNVKTLPNAFRTSMVTASL